MSYQVVFRADQKLLSKLEEVQAAGVFNAAPRANQKPVGELEEMQAADILNVADASRGQLLKYLGMGSSVADTDTLRRWVKEGGGAEDLVSVAGAVREGLLKHTGIAARVTYGEPPIGDVLQSHPRIRLPGRGKHILLLRADFEYTPTDTDEAARSLTTRRDAILGYFKYLRYGKES
jgi:uncharacterized membrane protein